MTVVDQRETHTLARDPPDPVGASGTGCLEPGALDRFGSLIGERVLVVPEPAAPIVRT